MGKSLHNEGAWTEAPMLGTSVQDVLDMLGAPQAPRYDIGCFVYSIRCRAFRLNQIPPLSGWGHIFPHPHTEGFYSLLAHFKPQERSVIKDDGDQPQTVQQHSQAISTNKAGL